MHVNLLLYKIKKPTQLTNFKIHVQRQAYPLKGSPPVNHGAYDRSEVLISAGYLPQNITFTLFN